jgi:two-component system chemotaxis sensor kinase CheA
MDMIRLKQKFIDEAESLLTTLDNILIDLEKGSNDQSVNEVFRVMHTIKGASGMFGYDKVVEITHEAESLYELMRDGKLNLSSELLEVSFSTAYHIRALLVDEEFTEEKNTKRHELLRTAFQTIRENVSNDYFPEKECNKKNETSGVRTWNILFYPSEELIKRCVNMLYTLQDLFALGEYRITSYSADQNETEFWNIFLVTEKSYQDIENALMFVMDVCKITEIANFNIFDSGSFEQRKREIQQQSTPIDTGNLNTPESYIQTTYHRVSGVQSFNDNKSSSIQNQRRVATTISVEVAKLDSLMYLVSELVTSKSELLIGIRKEDTEKILDASEKIDKLSKLFSDNALDIRLVSLHETLEKFKRLVRDLAKQLGKSINFVIAGEDTELDKTIIDAIGEPIMHLIRNNIDHGIEFPETRIEQGKPETGIVRFEAVKTGNNVFITISDDGKGIDPDYLYKKAIEKKFIQHGTQLTRKEILDLVFLPGFSTAQSLSDVSGRGVGMDIVQKKIKEIRGEITISSEIGKGTSFSIKLQQTMSIIDTLLVAANNTTYALPVEDIESCLLEAYENIANRQNNLIGFNNELIPFVSLSADLQNSPLNGDSKKLVIVKKQNKRYAIIADTIIGEYQAVIKPLGKTFSKVPFLSGASLLGDGSIALLIDTEKLWYETAMN